MNDDVGPYLSRAGWRALFPDPVTCSEQALRWETVLLGLRIIWAALRWDWGFVCVYAFRLKEIGEEGTGQPFNHGDHVAWYAWCKNGIE